jgi:HEAT repeat protein
VKALELIMDWKPFLSRWSVQMMQSGLAEQVDPPPESSDWLGFPKASAREITALEKRLGLTLPPSYREFLQVSNGWRRTTPFIANLRHASEANWFRIENEQWTEVYAESGSDLSDAEYFDYEKNGELHHRAAHMAHLVQISDVDDGVYLLNPQTVTPDGEWEAWFFANWIPGARRYPSFAHLMVGEYKSFAELEKIAIDEAALPGLATPAPDVPRVAAQKKRGARADAAAAAAALSLEELIEQMKSPDDKVRGKAVKTFFGKLKGRGRAPHREDLVQPLCDLFKSSADAGVRAACVAALTELTPKFSPPPLLASLSDPDPGVVLQGIFALSYFRDKRAVEPLCRFIESRANALFNENAISQLPQLKDERAIPTLEKVLLDMSNTFDQNFNTAGIALGQFARTSASAFDVLVKALDHPDKRVRFAAVCGLDVSQDPRTSAYLDRMENDPEEMIRKRAKTRVGHFMNF